jgi:hypothetical protein
VAQFVGEHFLPARVHVREQPEDFKRLGARFGAEWTPTILLLDPEGTERHRIEGYLPADDFMAQLGLGLGRVEFSAGDFAEAERQLREVVSRHPEADAAPEALYWAGVAKYKATGDAAALQETGEAFRQRYQDSSWAKKSSVWVE